MSLALAAGRTIRAMQAAWRRLVPWGVGWLAVVLAGALLIVRVDIAQRREAFQADARIAHRLLSQRAAQHDAILDTLALLAPAVRLNERTQPLAALSPQVLQVLRLEADEADEAWPNERLRDAQARSRRSGRPEIAHLDLASGRYVIVRAGEPASFALEVDAQRLVPWDEWPLQRGGPVSVGLRLGTRTLPLQTGESADAQPRGLTDGFVFAEALASPSQPFVLQLQRATGPAQWPWLLLAAWAGAVALAVAAWAQWRKAQRQRRRAEDLLRIGQVARLNALGEMAAGVAHELNQPLTAVLASAQAARRLLDDEPPEIDAARQAMQQAGAQARRAADVVARLRRRVEAPETAGAAQTVSLDELLRRVLDLVEPQARRQGVVASIAGSAPPARADPVALEQIVHNLVSNALLALDEVPAAERRLVLELASEPGHAVLMVRDSGPGIAPEALPRLFEPFYTTRRGGLGLGLSLCETLAQAMGGTLGARNAGPRGAEFRLVLPAAGATS